MLLRTSRIILRPVERADAADFFEFRSNADVMRYMDAEPLKTIEDAEQLINSYKTRIDSSSLSIVLKENKKVIGTCGLYAINKKHSYALLSYIISSDYWRKGLMEEALREFINYCFATLYLNRLEVQIHEQNIPSIKLAEKLGFVQEAVMRQNFFVGEKFYNSVLCSLIKEDFNF